MEGKGYKYILDHEAWLREYHIPVTSEKPYQNGKIYLLESCPFSTAHTGGAYAIQFANGAIHAGCHHHSCGAGKQRWKELREMYETDEEKQKIREGRLALGRRERAIAKVQLSGPEPVLDLPINCRLVYTKTGQIRKTRPPGNPTNMP